MRSLFHSSLILTQILIPCIIALAFPSSKLCLAGEETRPKIDVLAHEKGNASSPHPIQARNLDKLLAWADGASIPLCPGSNTAEVLPNTYPALAHLFSMEKPLDISLAEDFIVSNEAFSQSQPPLYFVIGFKGSCIKLKGQLGARLTYFSRVAERLTCIETKDLAGRPYIPHRLVWAQDLFVPVFDPKTGHALIRLHFFGLDASEAHKEIESFFYITNKIQNDLPLGNRTAG